MDKEQELSTTTTTPPPPPLPPRTQIKTQSNHSHSHSISQWAINHLLPTSLFNHHHQSINKSSSNSTWPPDEWFEPYSPKTNQSSTSSSSNTSTPSSSYHPNDSNIPDHPTTIIQPARRLPPKLFNHHQTSSSPLSNTTSSISKLNITNSNHSSSLNNTHQSTSSSNHPIDSPTHPISFAPIIPSRTNLIITDSPTNTISIAPPFDLSQTEPLSDQNLVTDSPTNTISLAPILSETDSNSNHQSPFDQSFVMQSPTNTISLAPIQSEESNQRPSLDQSFVMESPTNTISLAPIQSEESNQRPSLDQSFVMESPTNTISLAPIQSEETGTPFIESPINTRSIAPIIPTDPSHETNHINQTPTIPNAIKPTALPSSPSNPNLLSTPSTPSSITQSSRPSHTFHPPPLHPDLRPLKTVKETLDAHLYRSQDGHRQVNQYILKHDLGRGSFGAVRLAVDAQTGLEYAVKEFSKKRLRRKFGNLIGGGTRNNGGDDDEDALHLIRNEVAIMKKVQHPNIVKLYEVLDVEGEDSLYMVMEYCRGGRLESGISDVGLIRRYFRQLMIGIDYLHQNEIIHHDIKPDNILLSSDRKQIKIVDFGISALFESSDHAQPQPAQRLIGSPAFLSPELIAGKSSGGTESDIWAMGVTLYCMVEGKLPFGEKGEALDLWHDIQEEAPNIPETWDPRLIDLIAKMLTKDPESRIKLSEISSHLWITDSGKLPNLFLSAQEEDGSYKINKIHSELELRECLKIGFTDQCERFKEIVESSLRIGRGKRKEFFKEFYRLLGEKSVLKIDRYHNHMTK